MSPDSSLMRVRIGETFTLQSIRIPKSLYTTLTNPEIGDCFTGRAIVDLNVINIVEILTKSVVRIRPFVCKRENESGAKNHRIHHETEFFEYAEQSGYLESKYFQIWNLLLCKQVFLVNAKTF